MTRIKSFETAAGRRRKNPLIWDIDGTHITLVNSIDLGTLAEEIAAMQADGPPDETPMSKTVRKLAALRAFLGKFIAPDSVNDWNEVVGDLSIDQMSEMVTDLMSEYTGMDPTVRASSSGGSSPGGDDSTDGAPPAESTPSGSPPTAG